MVRVHLGHRRRAPVRRGQQDAERVGQLSQLQARAPANVLGDRESRERQDVHVHVNEQQVVACAPRHRARPRRDRVRPHLVEPDRLEAEPRDRRRFRGRDVVGAEEEHVGRAEHRPARTECAQLRGGTRQVEQMRDPGPVERSVAGVRNVEVHVEIDVDEADRSGVPQRSGDGPELDGAVAPEHEHVVAVRHRVGHHVRYGARGPRDRRDVHRLRVRGIRPPSKAGDVAPVADSAPRVLQRGDQTMPAERRRRVLLSGCVRARARRRTDDADRPAHRPGLSRAPRSPPRRPRGRRRCRALRATVRPR